jgi:hypothetical protein
MLFLSLNVPVNHPATSVIGPSALSCALSLPLSFPAEPHTVEHGIWPTISLELSTNSGMTTTQDGSVEPLLPELHYIQYDPDKEAQYLTAIRELISKDLSEPYSIYVYRYFLYQWADLCYMVS